MSKPTFCWEESQDFIDKMLAACSQGEDYFYQTYIPLLDKHVTNIHYTSLICIGARPGHGKSAFALYLAYSRLTHAPEETVLFFSLEMSKHEVHRRFFSLLTEIDQSKLSGEISDEILNEKIPYYFNKIKNYNIIFDCVEYRDIGKIKDRIKEAVSLHKSKNPVKTIIIDYLQIIKGDSSSSKELRYLEIGIIAQELKEIALQLECVIICLCQLSRKVEEKENNKNFKIEFSDFRESGNIEMAADILIGMHKKHAYDVNTAKVQFDVLKNRNGSSNTQFFLTFELPFSKFS